MKREKISSYIGFARKSRNLAMGSETVINYMNKKKIHLLLIASDISENSLEKLVRKAEQGNVKYIIFGTSEELSLMAGSENRVCFGIMDKNLAEVISNEIYKLSQ